MAGLNLLRYLLAWCGGMQPSSKMAAVVVKARGQAGAVRAAEFKMLTWGHPTLRISRIFFFSIPWNKISLVMDLHFLRELDMETAK